MLSVAKNSKKNLTNLIIKDFISGSDRSFFKRSFSYEQNASLLIANGNTLGLNTETYDLIFSSDPIKGYLLNFLIQKIQKIPSHMYFMKKCFHVETFFNNYPKLNIQVNHNDFSSIKYLNQRTSHIYELLGAEAMNRKYGEVYKLILASF